MPTQVIPEGRTCLCLIYKNFGQSEAELGNKDKAMDAWKKALTYEPDDDISSRIKQISGSK